MRVPSIKSLRAIRDADHAAMRRARFTATRCSVSGLKLDPADETHASILQFIGG